MQSEVDQGTDHPHADGCARHVSAAAASVHTLHHRRAVGAPAKGGARIQPIAELAADWPEVLIMARWPEAAGAGRWGRSEVGGVRAGAGYRPFDPQPACGEKRKPGEAPGGDAGQRAIEMDLLNEQSGNHCGAGGPGPGPAVDPAGSAEEAGRKRSAGGGPGGNLSALLRHGRRWKPSGRAYRRSWQIPNRRSSGWRSCWPETLRARRPRRWWRRSARSSQLIKRRRRS